MPVIAMGLLSSTKQRGFPLNAGSGALRLSSDRWTNERMSKFVTIGPLCVTVISSVEIVSMKTNFACGGLFGQIGSMTIAGGNCVLLCY